MPSGSPSSPDPTTSAVVTPPPAPTTMAAARTASRTRMRRTLRDAEGAERHPGQQVVHGLVGEQAAVRGGVDQPEGGVRHRPGPLEAEVAVHPAELVGPEVDVRALQGADLLAGVV